MKSKRCTLYPISSRAASRSRYAVILALCAGSPSIANTSIFLRTSRITWNELTFHGPRHFQLNMLCHRTFQCGWVKNPDNLLLYMLLCRIAMITFRIRNKRDHYLTHCGWLLAYCTFGLFELSEIRPRKKAEIVCAHRHIKEALRKSLRSAGSIVIEDANLTMNEMGNVPYKWAKVPIPTKFLAAWTRTELLSLPFCVKHNESHL